MYHEALCAGPVMLPWLGSQGWPDQVCRVTRRARPGCCRGCSASPPSASTRGWSPPRSRGRGAPRGRQRTAAPRREGGFSLAFASKCLQGRSGGVALAYASHSETVRTDWLVPLFGCKLQNRGGGCMSCVRFCPSTGLSFLGSGEVWKWSVARSWTKQCR